MKLNLNKKKTFKSNDCQIVFENMEDNIEEKTIDSDHIFTEEENTEKRFDLSEEEFNRELEQSYKKGYSEGMIKSIEQFESEHHEKIRQFEGINRSIEEEKEKLFRDLEEQVIAVSTAIAEKILIMEITDSKESLLKLVEKGFEKLKNSLKFTLYLNNENKNYFDSLDLELAKQKSASVSFEIDNKLENLDFYIESDQGNIYHILSEIFEQIRDIKS